MQKVSLFNFAKQNLPIELFFLLWINFYLAKIEAKNFRRRKRGNYRINV